MADADNIGRINIWRNSTIAASAAAVEPGTQAFGRMSIYRNEALARSHRHHEVPAEGGGGGYTGPLDLVPSAVVAYSTARALSSAMRGQPVYTIRENGGDTTQSFSSDAVTGEVDAVAITAFLDGANGFVDTWFDQSGNTKSAVQAGAADQPAWASSVQGGRPGLVASASTLSLTTSDLTFPSGGYTWFLVAKPGVDLLVYTSGDDFIETLSTTGSEFVDAETAVSIAAGSATETISDAPHLWEMAWEFGSRAYLVDGTPVALSDSDSGSALGSITGALTISLLASSKVLEVLLYDGLLSSPNRALIRQNIAAYYGINLA